MRAFSSRNEEAYVAWIIFLSRMLPERDYFTKRVDHILRFPISFVKFVAFDLPRLADWQTEKSISMFPVSFVILMSHIRTPWVIKYDTI